jgi:hypothetical protein
MPTEDKIKIAIEAVDGVEVHAADRTPMVGNRKIYEFLASGAVRDIVVAALTAVEKSRS